MARLCSVVHQFDDQTARLVLAGDDVRPILRWYQRHAPRLAELRQFFGRQLRHKAAPIYCGHALILLLLAAPVQAQEPRLKLALGAYITAGYFDAAITANCHGARTCNEQNPILRPIVDKHGVVAAMTVKGAMHAGIAAGLLKLSKEHPQRAFWLTVALTGAQVAVDVANVRTLRK